MVRLLTLTGILGMDSFAVTTLLVHLSGPTRSVLTTDGSGLAVWKSRTEVFSSAVRPQDLCLDASTWEIVTASLA